MMRNVCTADLVFQKIRSLNALVKFLEEISRMFKKNFVYLGLNKKNVKKLQTGLNKYIKTLSFTIYCHHFSYYKLLNLVNRVNQIKLDKLVNITDKQILGHLL